MERFPTASSSSRRSRWFSPLTSPEREFVKALLEDQNAKALKAWIKSPDVGFFEIEFGYEKNGRKKHGRFNPDFFLLLEDSDDVVVVETKADNDVSDINRGKAAGG